MNAEKPPSEVVKGTTAAFCGAEVVRFVPKMLRTIPGAKVCVKEAPLTVPPIVGTGAGPKNRAESFCDHVRLLASTPRSSKVRVTGGVKVRSPSGAVSEPLAGRFAEPK